MTNSEREREALEALSELKSIHQGIGSIASAWRRCRDQRGKRAKMYEKSYDELTRKSWELSEIISAAIRDFAKTVEPHLTHEAP